MSNAYKQAMNQARADSTTAALQARSAVDRMNAKMANGTATSADTDKAEEAVRNYNKALQNYNNAALQYRIDSDKQMLPSSTGEDKIKEAIYSDPKVQTLLENGQELPGIATKTGSSTRAMSFDQAYGNVSQNSSTTGGNIFTSAASGVSNAVNGAVSGVSNAVNNINSSDFTNAISNMVSNTVNEIANTADRLVGLANDASNKISSLFSSDSSKNAQTQALSGHSADKGQKETQTKVEQISADNHSAIKNPPACITKPITEVTVNTKSAPVEQKKEELPKDGPLSKVGDKLKEVTGVAATMTDAVKSVTNEISDNLKKATSLITDVKSAAQSVIDEGKKVASTVKESVDGVVDTAASVVRDVTSSITSVTAPVMSTITDTINTGRSLTNELASSLPGPLGQFVKAKSDNFFNNTINTIANSKITKFQNTLASLSNLGKSGDLTNAIGAVLLAHVGKKYSNVTDTSGLDLSHIFGSNSDKSKIDSYYEQLVKLCPELTNNRSTLNYSDNKTLFDALLALLTQDGAAGLLKQLLSCTASGSLYFDNSSVKVLQESAKEVTKSGDVESYKTILDKLGKSNLPNVKQDLITINANNDRDSAVVNAITFDSICTSINIEGKDLLVCDNAIKPSGTVYDANAIRLFTVNNTYTADKYISSDTRKLLQAAIYKNK